MKSYVPAVVKRIYGLRLSVPFVGFLWIAVRDACVLTYSSPVYGMDCLQYLEKGGRGGRPQDASKGATETIRCYG